LPRERVINSTLHPEMLESGQVLGAAGTASAAREDVQLTDGDRRRLRGKITVIPVDEAESEAENVVESE
jgi:hypothetical protein